VKEGCPIGTPSFYIQCTCTCGIVSIRCHPERAVIEHGHFRHLPSSKWARRRHPPLHFSRYALVPCHGSWVKANMGASPDAGLWRVIALVPCTSETAAQPVLARLRSAASQRDADPQAIVSLAVNLAHELAAKTVHVDRDAAHWSEEEERASLANGDERVQGHFETLLILG
jgi:hypothetical protein